MLDIKWKITVDGCSVEPGHKDKFKKRRVHSWCQATVPSLYAKARHDVKPPALYVRFNGSPLKD